MTNEINKINTEVFNLETGEALKTPAISLQVSNLLTIHNLKEVKLELKKIFQDSRIPITLQNYKYAKQNMVSLNKLKEAIETLIKEKIEIPETTLKEIKAEAKEVAKIIDEERQLYKTGYDEVYGTEMKKRVKKLILQEISVLYEQESLEEEYKIITEEQINKLCIISNGGFPQDREGDFENVYLTGKCKKEVLALVHNCLQFKQQRINRLQALELANFKAGLEKLHQITLDDIKSFLDAVDADFNLQLNNIIQKALKKQNDIKAEAERKLAEEKARLEAQTKAKEEEIRKQAEIEARIKAEAEAKIKIEAERALKAEAERKLAEEKAKNEILTPQSTNIVNKVQYEVICSYNVDVEDKGGQEMDEIRSKHLSQGFKTVKFIKK